MNLRTVTAAIGSKRAEAETEAAFNLIEVIAALAIFAVGIVALAGLFGALLRPLAEREDDTVAAGLMVPLRLELRRLAREANSLAPVRSLIRTAADSASAGGGESFLFAPRSGAFVAAESDERWAKNSVPPYFVITLSRNSSLPYGPETDLPECVTYTAEVRWPALVTGSSSEGPTPQSRLRLSGAVSP